MCDVPDREPLSSLFSRKLHFKVPDPKSRVFAHRQAVKHDCLLLCTHYGKVVAMVGRDDLFDPDGNRFACDI